MAQSDEILEGFAPGRHASAPEVLLEVSEFIVLHRDLPALFQALVERLPQIISFDALWLVLHEPERNTMRLHIRATPTQVDFDVVERSISDSPSGLVWRTQQPLLVQNIEEETRFPGATQLLSENRIRSFCIVPLTTAHRRLGAMGFGSQKLNAYGEADVHFLRQVARQVALAVDN